MEFMIGTRKLTDGKGADCVVEIVPGLVRRTCAFISAESNARVWQATTKG